MEDEVLQVPAWIDLTAIVIGSLSGAVIGVRHRFPVTGVLILATISGLGGGLIRDLLLNEIPIALLDRRYLAVAAVAAIGAFFFVSWMERISPVINVFDGLALGLFTIVGAEKAALAGLPFLSTVFIGTATSIGGGMLRDLLLGEVPNALRPGVINALAAVTGATIFGAFRVLDMDIIVAEVIAILLIAALRYFALYLEWEAPLPYDIAQSKHVRRMFVWRRKPKPG